MGRPVKVELGSDAYDVVPQPWVYLQHEIREFGAGLGNLEAFADIGDLDTVVADLGDRAYELIRIFIPDLMPKHRFMGYRSVDAMEEGTYDEEAARKAPTFAQIIDVVETSLRVNRLDVISRLKSVFPTDLIEAEVRRALAGKLIEQSQESGGTIDSSISPSPNGESPSSSSTGMSPTPQPAASAA
jgi:hypothetical protein